MSEEEGDAGSSIGEFADRAGSVGESTVESGEVVEGSGPGELELMIDGRTGFVLFSIWAIEKK